MRPAARNPDRDPRPLDRAGQKDGAVYAVVHSGMVYRFSGEQAVDDLQAFIEPLGQDQGVGWLATFWRTSARGLRIGPASSQRARPGFSPAGQPVRPPGIEDEGQPDRSKAPSTASSTSASPLSLRDQEPQRQIRAHAEPSREHHRRRSAPLGSQELPA
jgi:hypothetical protein